MLALGAQRMLLPPNPLNLTRTNKRFSGDDGIETYIVLEEQAAGDAGIAAIVVMDDVTNASVSKTADSHYRDWHVMQSILDIRSETGWRSEGGSCYFFSFALFVHCGHFGRVSWSCACP